MNKIKKISIYIYNIPFNNDFVFYCYLSGILSAVTIITFCSCALPVKNRNLRLFYGLAIPLIFIFVGFIRDYILWIFCTKVLMQQSSAVFMVGFFSNMFNFIPVSIYCYFPRFYRLLCLVSVIPSFVMYLIFLFVEKSSNWLTNRDYISTYTQFLVTASVQLLFMWIIRHFKKYEDLKTGQND